MVKQKKKVEIVLFLGGSIGWRKSPVRSGTRLEIIRSNVDMLLNLLWTERERRSGNDLKVKGM